MAAPRPGASYLERGHYKAARQHGSRRKPDAERRSELVSSTVTKAELDQIHAAAARERLTVSEWLRRIAVTAAKR